MKCGTACSLRQSALLLIIYSLVNHRDNSYLVAGCRTLLFGIMINQITRIRKTTASKE